VSDVVWIRNQSVSGDTEYRGVNEAGTSVKAANNLHALQIAPGIQEMEALSPSRNSARIL
jgi:hypothetical protein